MKKTIHLLSVAALLFTFMLSAINTSAQKCPHQNETNVNEDKGCCISAIPNLTEDQKNKIEALHKTHHSEMEQLHKNLEENYNKLVTAVKGNSNTEVSNSVEAVNLIQKQMMEKQVAYLQSVRVLLTDDQKTAFDQANAFLSGKNINGCNHSCQSGGKNDKKCDSKKGKKCCK